MRPHKIFFFLLTAVFLTLGFSISLQSLLAAWTSPTLAPPNGNAPAPLNVSATAQSKDGGMILNHLGAADSNGLIVEKGNVGIGTTGPNSKLHIGLDTGGHSSYITFGKGYDSASGFQWQRAGVLDASIYYDASEHLLFETDMTNAIAGGDFVFKSNAAELLTIKTGGNVGIGTTAPGAKLEVAGQIKITGGTPGADKVLTSDASGLASWQASSGGADNLGDHTATQNLNMNNFEVDSINYLDIRNVEGYGLRFWSSNAYAINMGNSAEYQYGPVTDYSIKMNMSNTASRGWTWGVDNLAPVAAINTQGNMQLAGEMRSSWVHSTAAGNNTFAGNVGIGTTNPSVKLDVKGQAKIGNSSIAWNDTGQSQLAIDVGAYGAAPVDGIRFFSHDTATGYNGWVGALITGNENGSWGTKSLRIITPTNTGAPADTIAFKDGKVGIMTIYPTARLSIGALGGTAASNIFNIKAGALNSAAGSELAIASLGFSSNNNSSLGIRAYRISAGSDWTTTAIGLGMDVDSTVRAASGAGADYAGLWINANGKIGINNPNPADRLDVTGKIHATGDICTDAGGGKCLSTAGSPGEYNCHWVESGVLNENYNNGWASVVCPSGYYSKGWRGYVTSYLDYGMAIYCCSFTP